MGIRALLDHWTADRRLLDACSLFSVDRGDPIECARRALEDGADPNRETFYRRWRKPTGRRNGEPIYGDDVYANYWRTPLSAAAGMGSAALVDMLLASGANPWLPGCGPSSGPRPSPMQQVLMQVSGVVGVVEVLDRHFEQIVDGYAKRCSTVPRIEWEDVLDPDRVSPQALPFLEKLKSAIQARYLQRDTQQPIASPHPHPRPRL